MKEQSHKQEMDAAVRGDFARLRARGVATTIAAEGEPPVEPEVAIDAADAALDDRPARSEPREQSLLQRLFRGG